MWVREVLVQEVCVWVQEVGIWAKARRPTDLAAGADDALVLELLAGRAPLQLPCHHHNESNEKSDMDPKQLYLTSLLSQHPHSTLVWCALPVHVAFVCSYHSKRFLVCAHSALFCVCVLTSFLTVSRRISFSSDAARPCSDEIGRAHV